MKDEYVSVEHIMLGLIDKANSKLKQLFKTFNIDKNNFLKLLNMDYFLSFLKGFLLHFLFHHLCLLLGLISVFLLVLLNLYHIFLKHH